MQIRQAHYLLAVVEHGSFTRAAEELHVSQPALSQQIRQIEEALGIQLLDRSGRTVRPTDFGRIYIEYVRRAVRELDTGRRAVLDVKNLATGSLQLAFTPTFTTYLVGPLIHLFRRRYPGVSVLIDVVSQNDMELALANDIYDLGIAPGAAQSDEIEALTLYEEMLCLIVGPDYEPAIQPTLAATGLNGRALALLSRAFATRKSIDLYLRSNGICPRIVVESNSVDSLIAVVSAGGLATILPEAAGRDVPGLRSVHLSPSISARTVSLLRRRGAYRSVASSEFERLVIEMDWRAVQAGLPIKPI